MTRGGAGRTEATGGAENTGTTGGAGANFAPAMLRLYLVTDAPERCRRGLLETVDAAVAGGVTLVQYRTAHAKKGAAYAEALALRDLLRARGVPFLVNDHIDLALAADADGAHVGQRDLPAAAARRLLGAWKILGLSVNNPVQLAAAAVAGDLAAADYIGCGPVFPTRTKSDTFPVVGLDALAEMARRSPLPVVAIGGIGAGNVAGVRASGVAGVAVVSAICAAAEPAAAARALLAPPRP
ncbi:MAG: thiamine phosphate synthase [Puniceicoccales bacterium]|jgi:thiamine-phosphate pyrophosphorylase|nr:thiamine phosphate synthase [Puniceicoccales bacterium]